MFFTASFVILITLLNIIVYKLRQLQEANFGNKVLSLSPDQLCRRFSLAEIQLATNNFDEALVIGKGGFGKVYKGFICNGVNTVAIKRLGSKSNQGAPEFWTEIEMLSRFRHSHLVSLIGYCDDYQEMIIVYEYMHGGTLADHLHKVSCSNGNFPLSWVQRLKICIGAARGLDYLHTGTSVQHRVIHRDVKSSNILLDENLVAKISDFGLSKLGPASLAYTNASTTHVSTNVKGTFGYMDPEYFQTRRLTRKSDVYAFGVVLFEVLCGRPAVDFSLDEEQHSLAGWVKHCIKDERLAQITDPRLEGQILSNCLMGFVQTANLCLHNDPKKRPTMAEVVVWLESALALQEQPDSSDEPELNDIGGGGARHHKSIWSKHFGVASGSQIRVKPDRTMPFTKKLWLFLFGSFGAVSVHSEEKLSRHSKSKNNRRRSRALSDGGIVEEVPSTEQIVTPKIFSLAELESTTENFNQDVVLGEGSFGKIFKGWIDEKTYTVSKAGVGMAIAIKKLTPTALQGIEEIELKVKYLGGFLHPNLVRLVGYCRLEKEFLAVYEYMQEGSLESHLFRKGVKPLPWNIRLKIAIGAARGLAFLHSAEKQVIFPGFKASNILLDGEFNAKLSNYGLATLGPIYGDPHGTTFVKGTSGYAAPEYLATGRLDAMSDVYCFGVVMLEMLTGQPVIDVNRPREMRDLVHWAWPFLAVNHKLKTIMDPRMVEYYPPDGAFNSVVPALILRCVENDPKNRPSMKEVLETLEQCNSRKGKQRRTVGD